MSQGYKRAPHIEWGTTQNFLNIQINKKQFYKHICIIRKYFVFDKGFTEMYLFYLIWRNLKNVNISKVVHIKVDKTSLEINYFYNKKYLPVIIQKLLRTQMQFWILGTCKSSHNSEFGFCEFLNDGIYIYEIVP